MLVGYSPAQNGDPGLAHTLCWVSPALTAGRYVVVGPIWESSVPLPQKEIPGMKTSYEYVAVTRPDVWKHKPEEFADSSFVEELDKSGFIKRLYER